MRLAETQQSAADKDASADLAEAWAAVEAKLCGSHLPWLRSLRRAALERAVALGFPDQRQEAWKFTSSVAFAKRLQQTAANSAQAVTAIQELPAPGLPSAYEFVFVDGLCSRAPESLPQGVTAASLQALLSQRQPAEQPLFGVSESDQADAFALLNLAYFNDGFYLQVAPEVTVDRPIHLRYYSSAGNAPLTHHFRNVLRLGNGARLTLVESWHSLSKRADLTNICSTLELQQGAVLEHVRLQCEAEQSLHLGYSRATLGEASRLLLHSLSLGGLATRNELQVVLAGEVATAQLNGLYMGAGRQHHDQQLHVRHLAAATRSEQYYYGVLDGRAQGVFRGMIEVAESAPGTDARQVNRNLLLSEHAEAVTLPQLQILTNDVKCSHGATVGQLSEEALFYLRSRGIDAAAARALLTRAFAWEALTHIEDQPVQQWVEQTVANYLPGTAVVAA